jgi:hypothetical protein
MAPRITEFGFVAEEVEADAEGMDAYWNDVFFDIAILSGLWNRRFEPPRRCAPPLLVQGGEFPQPV